MQTLVDIGPSNASQGQHRRNDATEQMKNPTLARTRTLVLGFSSAEALPTKLRVPVDRTWILIFISSQILNSLRCLPFMWTLFSTCCYLVSFYFFIIVQCYTYIVVHIYCHTYNGINSGQICIYISIYNYIYIYISKRSITPQLSIYSAKSLGVLQSMYFCNNPPPSRTYIYILQSGSIILGTAQNIAKTQYTRIKFNFRVTHYLWT